MATTKSLFSTAALLLFVGMALVNIQQAEAQCGGFKRSCGGFAVADTGVFSAQCKDKIGNQKQSSINLNNYISNIHGSMIAPGTGFTGSCSGLDYDTSDGTKLYLVAGCSEADGTTTMATYDLNSHISNDNGILAWHKC